MGALPVRIESKRELPDYLPARMVNEFCYCPRLFFYEWVDGLFAESVDTVEGAIQHKRVDEKASKLPAADEGAAIHARSVTLSSERLRVIAKMDLVELDGDTATPVDYKHGRPREDGDGGLELGRRTVRNWQCRRSCCGRMGIGARRGWCFIEKRGSARGWRSTPR